MRKLASIRKIEEIKPIPNADAIEACRVDEWWVVAKKGQHSVGELVVFCEVDSWIPHELAPFLSNTKEPREYEGIKGERLRTVKLRGQLSQGLLFPLSDFDTHEGMRGAYSFEPPMEGDDVTDALGIIKWEQPIPSQLSGQIKGSFPYFIPKTDQERIQNLKRDFDKWKSMGFNFEITEKLDGSSCTIYYRTVDGEEDFGVCSRNLDLMEDDCNSFWRVAKRDEIIEKLRDYGKNIALQGELVGPGIQGNRYKLDSLQLFIYDVYDIDSGTYLRPANRVELVDVLQLNHVPVVGVFDEIFPNDVSIRDLLDHAEGNSELNPKTEREGFVYKNLSDGRPSFKVISNTFLITNED